LSTYARGQELYEASTNGALHKVNALLQSGIISDEARGLALCNAAAGGYPEVVSVLLESKPPLPSHFINQAKSEGQLYPAVQELLSQNKQEG